MQILLKTFLKSEFNCFPLTWMCHSRGLNNKINKWIKTKKSNLQDLLLKDKSLSILMKKLMKHLATEIYKLKNVLSPETAKKAFIFQENENHNLKSGTHLINRNWHTVYFGTDTITNFSPKLWKLWPDEIKNTKNRCLD